MNAQLLANKQQFRIKTPCEALSLQSVPGGIYIYDLNVKIGSRTDLFQGLTWFTTKSWTLSGFASWPARTLTILKVVQKTVPN
jgi:hypothetical protein